MTAPCARCQQWSDYCDKIEAAAVARIDDLTAAAERLLNAEAGLRAVLAAVKTERDELRVLLDIERQHARRLETRPQRG